MKEFHTELEDIIQANQGGQSCRAADGNICTAKKALGQIKLPYDTLTYGEVLGQGSYIIVTLSHCI